MLEIAYFGAYTTVPATRTKFNASCCVLMAFSIWIKSFCLWVVAKNNEWAFFFWKHLCASPLPLKPVTTGSSRISLLVKYLPPIHEEGWGEVCNAGDLNTPLDNLTVPSFPHAQRTINSVICSCLPRRQGGPAKIPDDNNLRTNGENRREQRRSTGKPWGRGAFARGRR